MKRYRKTYAEINLRNIYMNYLYAKEQSNKEVIPVVKANAYGHGAIEVVKYLSSKGVSFFAVSLLEEALELRKEFPSIDLLVLGVTHISDFRDAAENNIVVTISNLDKLQIIHSYDSPLRVHLKVDTGMNRLGFKDINDIKTAIKVIDNCPSIKLEGIFTHFATMDNDLDYYKIQRARFEKILEELDHNFSIVHAGNSIATLKFEKNIESTTHTRLGISLYGATLDEDKKGLVPTFKLITKISEIKKLKCGDKVGYGATYEAKEDEIIGILPLGYADGFIRKNGSGYVEISNKLYKIVGRICMDQMFIKIDETITMEDDVILFGGMITVDDVANRLDTINYEVFCQISYRVPRVYIK